MWNKNERNGQADQAKGKIKQAVGTLTGNDKLKSEGQVDETVGKVEAAAGRAGKRAGDARHTEPSSRRRDYRAAASGSDRCPDLHRLLGTVQDEFLSAQTLILTAKGRAAVFERR